MKGPRAAMPESSHTTQQTATRRLELLFVGSRCVTAASLPRLVGIARQFVSWLSRLKVRLGQKPGVSEHKTTARRSLGAILRPRFRRDWLNFTGSLNTASLIGRMATRGLLSADNLPAIRHRRAVAGVASEPPGKARANPITFQRSRQGAKALRVVEHFARGQIKIHSRQDIYHANACRDTMLFDHGQPCLDRLQTIDADRHAPCGDTYVGLQRVLGKHVAKPQPRASGTVLRSSLKHPLVVVDRLIQVVIIPLLVEEDSRV